MRLESAVPAAAALALGLSLTAVCGLPAQKGARNEPVPHGQDRMPGPALSPAEAIRKMTVPPGFTVELVASEPELVNPVAMTFDEKGRIWVAESLEYPRRSAGPGRDRIKVFEDKDGDGKYETVTVFAEGLNIPSGIAVGHGGVWVANSPDILFYKVGPDGKAAGKPEVVVTGFGRTDTHELPNSLTWGPDGWLYGLNGVFNYSRVRQKGKEWAFTCALFRIHPRTREFQLFCEGTSNPWGIAIDGEGSFFVSACVIDHLWHLAETGYYHRQAGPYPPFTWKIDSIVRHRHQKAAYCGLVWFDSDAYPAEYREKLYMGNIHGGCVNSDMLTRDGSTYLARTRPDFLTANDQWFMPVAQKVGPDGCLHVLDWYDRYHCYQDANRDPAGIDRRHGRLYRVRYKGTPRAAKFDLASETDDRLIERLGSPNVYFRDLAQRLLCERLPASAGLRPKLEKLALDDSSPRKARLHALWALVGAGPLEPTFHRKLLTHADAGFRAWGVRAAGNAGKVGNEVRDGVVALAKDRSPDVLLQVAVAAPKLEGVRPLPLLIDVLAQAGDDRLIPHIVWQNLHPLLEERAGRFLAVLRERGATPNLGRILPRVIERVLASRKPDPAVLADLLAVVREGRSADAGAARQVLAMLATKVQSGEIQGAALAGLRTRLGPVLSAEAEKPGGPLRQDALLLAATLGEKAALPAVRRMAERGDDGPRLRALEALVAARDEKALEAAGAALADGKRPAGFRAGVLAALGRLDDDRVAPVVLARFDRLEGDLKPRAVELLTQRAGWAKALLKAVAEKKVAAGVLNVNQARRLLASRDAELVKLVREHYGTVREERNPAREKVVAQMRRMLERTKGDPERGITVYKKLCAQCHKIHGEGVEVGPDITSNGRSTFEQLLSNVFDPSLVIGAGYQAVTVETVTGRSLTGLLVEDSPARVVLKVQGGKQEVVARKDVERVQVSKLSLMPEDVEKQLGPQEIADLFAFLALDRPPGDPRARRIPGTPKGLFGR
jgi:putative membrane-bound dehydrogenase-like protein